MGATFTELRCREVICIGSGQRLGFVQDVRIRLPEGCIDAVLVPGRCRLLGLLGPKEDYVIPWRCITRIGPDLILADICPEACRRPRERGGLLP